MALLPGLFGLFKTKKPPKSDADLLLDEYTRDVVEIKAKNLNEHAFLCELIHSLSFANTQRYLFCLEKRLTEKDPETLNNLIFQYARASLLPGCSGGYDQCERVIPAFFALACGDLDSMKRLFPQGLPASKNGYPFLCVMYDLIAAILWQDEDLLAPALLKAGKFAASKKPLNEREAIKFMLALHAKEATAMSEHLQQFCASFGRTAAPKFEKRLYLFAHGLHALARYTLPFEIFEAIKLPKSENFSKFYAERLFQNEIPKPQLYFAFPPEFEKVNVILNAPPARTRIYQPHLPGDKTYLLDHDAMINDLADEILQHHK
ncbi:hypothetical protein [uncultured Haemophilus sp.]|jgi:hypothetical protein|uniref:hypothetical protein n=1 Tax=uncultured Haemophilus sp. TaxID=237779 RepID=UPI002803752A|nr:hypothetical protein [uncultured Haemophilus sp.]